jgi:tetratricopeptide (TPR) repeat protein
LRDSDPPWPDFLLAVLTNLAARQAEYEPDLALAHADEARTLAAELYDQPALEHAVLAHARGQALSELGRHDEALDALREADRILVGLGGGGHPQRLIVLRSIAGELDELGSDAKARSVLEDADALIDGGIQAPPDDAAHVKLLLAQHLPAQRRAHAIELLRDAVELSAEVNTPYARRLRAEAQAILDRAR